MINDTMFTTSITVTNVVEREISPLNIDVELNLIFGIADPYHQAIGLERVRFFLNNILHKAIICGRDNEIISDLYGITDTRIVECWDDPWDQFIALMIFYKVTAILEGAATVEYIKVSAKTLAEDLGFTYYAKDFSDEMLAADWSKTDKGSVWYHRPDTTINENTDLEMTWRMLGMDWSEDANDPESTSPNVKKFTPKIIK